MGRRARSRVRVRNAVPVTETVRRPCSDPAKSNREVGQPAPKNCFVDAGDMCDAGLESGIPGKGLGADRLRSRRTASGRRRCAMASGRSGRVSGIAGVLEGRRAPSGGSKVPPLFR